MTPTQRSLAHLRKTGWTVAIVEKWNPHVGPHGIRQDLFGCLDLLAVRPIEASTPSGPDGILGVQCCAGSSAANRVAKILAEPRARTFLEAGGRIVVHAWRKTNDRQRGKRKTWKLDEREISLSDFPGGPAISEPWQDGWAGDIPQEGNGG